MRMRRSADSASRSEAGSMKPASRVARSASAGWRTPRLGSGAPGGSARCRPRRSGCAAGAAAARRWPALMMPRSKARKDRVRAASGRSISAPAARSRTSRSRMSSGAAVPPRRKPSQAMAAWPIARRGPSCPALAGRAFTVASIRRASCGRSSGASASRQARTPRPASSRTTTKTATAAQRCAQRQAQCMSRIGGAARSA